MVEKVFQNVLILNDDPQTTRLLLEILAARGIRGAVVRNAASAAKKLIQKDWSLVLADLRLAEADGLKFLRRLKEDDPELAVVAISERHSAEEALKAMRMGCQDLLLKPIAREAFEELLDILLPNHDAPLAAGAEDTRCLYQIVGRNERFLAALQLARKVAPTSVPVLITGESGTGKELISYHLHRHSRRSTGPYVRVNCAALSESLLESELFGHERGAFTGAYSQRKGRFERAHGGTLLLDEISETTPRLQAELLRVMEQQDFERVGGSEPVRVNVRVISTSNKDLPALIRRGEFRSDLYWRICGVHLHAPSLRERNEDIPILVWHFVNQYAGEVRRGITELDGEMMRLFGGYHWPGNVRQLRNVVRTALILGEGSTLSLDAAPHLLRELQTAPTARFETGSPDPWASAQGGCISLQELERQAIFEALRRTNSHRANAARLLGITDRTLREKLRRYSKEALQDPADGCAQPPAAMVAGSGLGRAGSQVDSLQGERKDG